MAYAQPTWVWNLLDASNQYSEDTTYLHDAMYDNTEDERTGLIKSILDHIDKKKYKDQFLKDATNYPID